MEEKGKREGPFLRGATKRRKEERGKESTAPSVQTLPSI